MENQTPQKKRVKHPDRVTLSAEALTRLSNWITETEGRLKGSRLTKSDLVNFLVLSHSEHLAERELEQLERDHFDEVRFAAWAVRQIKEAKAKGTSLSLSDIVNAASGPVLGMPSAPAKNPAIAIKERGK